MEWVSSRAFSRPALAVTVAAVSALATAACGGSGGDAGEADPAGPLQVVATTTILGDVAENIVGDAGTVETLMSPGQDPHSFDLSAGQAKTLRDADLVIANGLDLEVGFTDVLLDAREAGTPVIFIAEEVDPIPSDPHVWMDPLRMAAAARLIGAELEAITGTEGAVARAEAYASTLEALDAEIGALLGQVSPDARKLVTNHDALGYFAERYGFEVVGVVIPRGSTLAEPSASEVTELVNTIERESVPAIFAETTATARLAEVVADETGEDVEVVTLYTGSLGEDGSGAETYVLMIRTNAERISAAL